MAFRCLSDALEMVYCVSFWDEFAQFEFSYYIELLLNINYMNTYTYPPFYRFLYRYGNIPANLLLIFYLFLSAEGLNYNLLNIIPLVLNLVILYLLNKHYIMLYKILPQRIESDDEKIVASDFLFSSRRVAINFKDISDLKGGIFDGRLSGVMKVEDGPTKQVIGFFGKLRGVEKLQTDILSKVERKLYDTVIERVGLKKKNK
jgi:hypothetical protein